MPSLLFKNGTTLTARTIMFAELEQLLNTASDPNTTAEEYKRLVVEENVLSKLTMKNRSSSFRHLKSLYELDPKNSLFTAFRFLWDSSVQCRHLLTAQFAYMNDIYFRSSAEYVLKLPIGQHISTESIEKWIISRFPENSRVTLASIARNLNSSWTQAGLFEGLRTRSRIRVKAMRENAVFAVFAAHLSGLRGMMLFENEFTDLLELKTVETVFLAETAARAGQMTMRRLGDVAEVEFPLFKPEKGEQAKQ